MAETLLIPAAEVRRRLGNANRMKLWRLCNDKNAGFPKPVVLRKRHYWKIEEFEAWLASLPVREPPAKREKCNDC